MYYQALVNKTHKYDKSMFTDIKLLEITDIDNNNNYIEEETYNKYIMLKQEFYNTYNYNLDISFSYDNTIIDCPYLWLNILIDKEKEIDMEKYKLLKPLLAKYGFIANTNNPWHIRYVREKLAKTLYEENYTLEDYYHNLSGLLVIDKDSNMTSRDVVNIVSKYLYTKKIGHTGTLDPMATGVLVLTVGNATKLSEIITSKEKEYIATAKIGISTDTLDTTGNIINGKKEKLPSNLNEVLNTYQKTYLQEVPLYSAIKVNGMKLYEYARKNIEVKLPRKEVTIKNIELLNTTKDSFTFKTTVSKGTYIRSLIRDIGNSLNIYTAMDSLRRTKQGVFSIDQAYKIIDIKNGNYSLHNGLDALAEYDQLVVKEDDLLKVLNGVSLPNFNNYQDIVIIISNDNKLLAIYKAHDDVLKAWKVLAKK